jgi:hypothetical protein
MGTLRQIDEHNRNVEVNCGRQTLLIAPGAASIWAGFPSTTRDPSPLASGYTTATAGG